MLYAYPGDLVFDRDPLAFIEARYVGPLVHELSHFHAAEVPAPANLHEALAAWIGSEAWPAQVWPEAGDEDALPGGAFFAAVGGWIARAVGDSQALHVQAGLLDLRDALGAPCAEALRLYGFLPFLETGAPHLLADAFQPGRWWKLIDLHRDPRLARDFHQRLVAPLLRAPPPAGEPLQEQWNAALDALSWRELPAFRDPPREIDGKLAHSAAALPLELAEGLQSVRGAAVSHQPEDGRDGAVAAALVPLPRRGAAQGGARGGLARRERAACAEPLRRDRRERALVRAGPDRHPLQDALRAGCVRAGARVRRARRPAGVRRTPPAGAIAAEIAELQRRTDFVAFSFFDDSFAVGRRRMLELCGALDGLRVQWTCTAHPAHLDRDILARMKRAGCAGVDIGMESGDPDMLLRIGKGVTVERVLEVLASARDLGLHCMLNLMFGWPGETLSELRTTVDFIERSAPLAAAFNARGVLVPYPGTQIYEENHAKYGFTEWWLREPPLRYRPFPSSWSLAEVKRAYADDVAIERNFFRHPPAHLELMQEGLCRKADATYRKLRKPAAPGWEPLVPAAGAR